jgi:hypothetical protein
MWSDLLLLTLVLSLLCEGAILAQGRLASESGGAASSSKWRYCQRPRGASSFYLADGWSSEVSDGCRGFAACFVIMSDYLKR